MNKSIADWASRALVVVGVVLVGSMFLSWVDVWGHTESGLSLAWDDRWLFLVPVAGALLAAAAGSKSPYTRLAAVFAGVVVCGDVLFEVAKGIIHGGVASWLVFGGAGAMIAGCRKDGRALRVLGGLAVIVGFVAPWTDDSMWKMLRSDHLDMVTSFGITVRVLWIIPVAGLAAIAGAAHPEGGKISAGAGVAVLGSILWVMFSAAKLVFGIGAWAALGASTTALVLGILAPAAAGAAAAALPVAKVSKK